MCGVRKTRSFQICRGFRISRAHWPKLQMSPCELICHTSRLALLALGKSQALALVLFGIGKTRVDGKHERRITISGYVVGVLRSNTPRTQEPLPARPPQAAIDARCQARFLETVTVANKTIACKLQLRGIGAPCPFLYGNGGLHHALAIEQAAQASIIQTVERGIHLAAHGICRHP